MTSLSRHLKIIIGINVIAIVLLAAAVGGFFSYYETRFDPGTQVSGVSISGLSQAEAQAKLATELELDTLPAVIIKTESIEVASSASELGLFYPVADHLDIIWNTQKRGPIWSRLGALLTSPATPNQDLFLDFDTAAIENLVATTAAQVDQPGELAQASLAYTGAPGSLTVTPGKLGKKINIEATWEALLLKLAQTPPPPAGQTPHNVSIYATVQIDGQQLSDEEQAQAKTRAQAFIGKTTELKAHETTLRLNDQAMVELLTFPTGLNHEKITQVVADWATRVNRPSQDAVFEYEPDTLKVTQFTPPRDGLALDQAQAQTQISETMTKIETDQVLAAQATATQSATPTTPPPSTYTADLVVRTTPPTHTLSSTNDLGIKERIGFGDSEYAHSIPSRIHNVALAASRINNHIIKPGEEFRFNDTLGDVSRASGYQPAYVIQSGKTVLGDGGGVCQVSTTVFRAALNAGLPITKRKAHSYRVSYYELDRKPGIDATVYSGEVDLRFKNDTGGHVLIHTETDSENLYMKVEMYGTSDGRTTEIVDHKTWDFRGPPAPVYIPDPSLPPGRVKQIDWAASGIKASFKNIVKDKDGNLIREEEFFSNYVPWSAKYLRGV